MAKSKKPPQPELESLLSRLEETKAALVETLEAASPDDFSREDSDGDSIKRALERTVDDLNFYYGRLTARALNLPQPPCLTRAEFGSLREGTMALQVAHRRFTNLLHDLIPEDLEREASDADAGTYKLRQVLEMAAGQYSMRSQQVARLAEQKSRPA